MATTEYDTLLAAALAAPVEGWDFGALRGRVRGSDPSWSYPDLAHARIASAQRLLDIDTGGGELLATLGPLPRHTWATEGWPPNIPIAHRRLTPLGVTVLPTPEADVLPLPDESVDLVLNRHGRLTAREIHRVLRPGGILLTQQVGSDDCADLNTTLGAPPAHPPGSWDLHTASTALSAAGMTLTRAAEEHPPLTFYDIGAIIHHLRLVAWQIPDFTPDHHDSALRHLDRHIRTEGHLTVHSHRFLLTAERRG